MWCQRFFRSRAASGWFQVLPPPPTPGAAVATAAAAGGLALPLLPKPEDRLLSLVRQTASQLQARATAVEDQGGKLEPNPWLRRVGWAAHLAGLDAAVLRGMASLVAHDGWPTCAGHGAAAARAAAGNNIRLLQLAWQSTGRTIGAA